MMKSRNRSQTKKLLMLAALSLLAVAAYMLVNVNFAKPKLFQYAMRLRTPKVLAMVITAFAIGGASIVFQSVINNTIVTPCLLGMNSLSHHGCSITSPPFTKHFMITKLNAIPYRMSQYFYTLLSHHIMVQERYCHQYKTFLSCQMNPIQVLLYKLYFRLHKNYLLLSFPK